VINRIDNRMIILFSFLLTALSMWQMTQFSLQMGMMPVVISGLLQGFGLGCTFVPLAIIALSNLPRHILTQGTAIRSVMRNLGARPLLPLRSAPHPLRSMPGCRRDWRCATSPHRAPGSFPHSHIRAEHAHVNINE
jgi:hypothetical protein